MEAFSVVSDGWYPVCRWLKRNYGQSIGVSVAAALGRADDEPTAWPANNTTSSAARLVTRMTRARMIPSLPATACGWYELIRAPDWIGLPLLADRCVRYGPFFSIIHPPFGYRPLYTCYQVEKHALFTQRRRRGILRRRYPGSCLSSIPGVSRSAPCPLIPSDRPQHLALQNKDTSQRIQTE